MFWTWLVKAFIFYLFLPARCCCCLLLQKLFWNIIFSNYLNFGFLIFVIQCPFKQLGNGTYTMTCSLGNPNVECVRIPSTCFSSTDCPASMQCADGICMPGCQSDENCAVNERCLQGLCMREYLTDIICRRIWAHWHQSERGICSVSIKMHCGSGSVNKICWY